MVRFFELASIHSSYHVLLGGCLGFEHFIFGSCHDFLISDFSPFSQSRLSNQYFFTCQDGVELLFIFLLYSWILGFVYDLGMGKGSAS